MESKISEYIGKYYPDSLKETQAFAAKIPVYFRAFVNTEKEAQKDANFSAYLDILQEMKHPLLEKGRNLEKELDNYSVRIIKGDEKFAIGKATKMDSMLDEFLTEAEKCIV